MVVVGGITTMMVGGTVRLHGQRDGTETDIGDMITETIGGITGEITGGVATAAIKPNERGGFLMKALGTTILLAVVLVGSGGVFAAEKGRGRSNSDTQWYADPDRGWIKSDERRDRKEDRRDSSNDRRSNQRERDKSDKGKGRGSSDR